MAQKTAPLVDRIPRYIASFLETEDHKLTLTFCSHDAKNEKMSCLITASDGKEVILQPLSIRGHYKDFLGTKDDELTPFLNGRNGLWDTVRQLRVKIDQLNNLEAIEKELVAKEKAIADKKSKLDKIKPQASRFVGFADPTQANALATLSATDGNHKTVLEQANYATLIDAISRIMNIPNSKARYTKVSSEIKKVCGTSAEDAGYSYDPESLPTPESQGNYEAQNSQGILFDGGVE